MRGVRFELPELLFHRVKSEIHGFTETFRTIRRYWFPIGFWRVDLRFHLAYAFRSPFQISRRYWSRFGGRPPVYGETPLSSCEEIARFAGIERGDTFFELGCGRGKTCFFFQALTGCRAVGLEAVPDFVDTGCRIARSLGIDAVELRRVDLLEADYTEADILYFYGTSAENSFVEQLVETLARDLRSGTRVVTVSYPLEEVVNGAGFVLIGSIPVRYPWGTAEVYLQVFRPPGADAPGTPFSCDQVLSSYERRTWAGPRGKIASLGSENRG